MVDLNTNVNNFPHGNYPPTFLKTINVKNDSSIMIHTETGSPHHTAPMPPQHHISCYFKKL